MRKTIALAASLGTLLLLLGCGSDPLDRAAIEGKVSFNGKPISRGEIRFVPMPGQQGLPVAGAVITDGEYLVNNKGGVPAGEYRVEFQMFISAGGSSELDGAAHQVLPGQFNKKSKYTLTVPTGGKAIKQDYDLQS